MWNIQLNKIQLLGKLFILTLLICGLIAIAVLALIFAVKFPASLNVQLLALLGSIVTVGGTLLGVMVHSLFDKSPITPDPPVPGAPTNATTINAQSVTHSINPVPGP